MRSPSLPLPILLVALGGGNLLHATPTIAGGNGSFETNTRGTAAFGGGFGQIWYLNPLAANTSGVDIPGWTLFAPGGTLPPNTNTAWLMGDNTYGAPSDGIYQINVEGGPDWWLRASLDNLTIGSTYSVSFQSRRRQGSGSGTFDVFVDTATPTQVSPSPASTSWAPQSLTFVAEAATHTLTISNTDNPANNGFMVDQFSIAEETWVAGDGVWTAGDGNWNTATNWQSNTIAQGGDRSANFNGLTPVTATVDVNRPIGALLFSGANHTLAAGIGSLTLDGGALFATPSVTVANGITATIAATLNGNEGLLKDGAGTLVLSGNNTYSGGTTVSIGTLKLELGPRSGNPPFGSFSVDSGATLNLDNTNTVVGSYYPQSFVLSGEGTLTKTNTGSIDLWTGSNLTGFTGTVNVQQGSLRVNNIGTAANMAQATLEIAAGATFDVRYNARLSVDKLTGSGILDQSSNFGGGLGAVTIGANHGSSTFNGSIRNTSGVALPVTKSGTGTFTLAGINTYTGNTTINDGTLILADDARLTFVVTHSSQNTIGGSGTATLKGDFLINTTAVTGATAGTWLLVDIASLAPASSFDDATFTVIDFVDPENDGIWTMTDAKGNWAFSEATGTLSLAVGSDYDDWGATYGLTTGSEGGDLDTDGLSNFEEYAFGLLPNSGSSVNPIISQFNKTTGQFTYQRRLQSNTDINYSVRSSTTLATNEWNNLVKDTDYTESLSAAGDIETVTITLTPVPTSSKLFIQIKAEAP